jgi:hypothetical protein
LSNSLFRTYHPKIAVFLIVALSHLAGTRARLTYSITFSSSFAKSKLTDRGGECVASQFRKRKKNSCPPTRILCIFMRKYPAPRYPPPSSSASHHDPPARGGQPGTLRTPHSTSSAAADHDFPHNNVANLSFPSALPSALPAVVALVMTLVVFVAIVIGEVVEDSEEDARKASGDVQKASIYLACPRPRPRCVPPPHHRGPCQK